MMYNKIIMILGIIVVTTICIYTSIQLNKCVENFSSSKKVNLIIGFLTYPRNGIDTPNIFKRTITSLFENKDLNNYGKIKIIIVGDDYDAIQEQIKPLFEIYPFEVSIYNINHKNALRNMKNVPSMHKWEHACTRSVIYLIEKAMEEENNYDYLMISSDDDLYINDTLKSYNDGIIQFNSPDLIFCNGVHNNGEVLPKQKYADPTKNSPTSGDTIASGIFFSLTNKEFINDILKFRKNRWNHVQTCINNNYFHNIGPEDAELWDYLKPKFENNVYRSALIDKTLINHDTEGTINKYIS